jgi:hypothetical protein
MKRKAIVAAVAMLALGSSARAEAHDSIVGPALRPKMPEPLLTESVTDQDGTEAGELELDLNGSAWRRTSGPRQWQSSLEIEWRAFERLGVSLELGVGGLLEGGARPVMSMRPAASWVLLHAPSLDFHLMVEASARISRDDSDVVQDPGEGRVRRCVARIAGAPDFRARSRAGLTLFVPIHRTTCRGRGDPGLAAARSSSPRRSTGRSLPANGQGLVPRPPPMRRSVRTLLSRIERGI